MTEREFIDWTVAKVGLYGNSGTDSVFFEVADEVERACGKTASRIVQAMMRLVRDHRVELTTFREIFAQEMQKPDYAIATLNAPDANIGADLSEGKSIHGKSTQRSSN